MPEKRRRVPAAHTCKHHAAAAAAAAAAACCPPACLLATVRQWIASYLLWCTFCCRGSSGLPAALRRRARPACTTRACLRPPCHALFLVTSNVDELMRLTFDVCQHACRPGPAAAEGKPIPTELRQEEADLRRQVELEDDNTGAPAGNTGAATVPGG